MVAQVARKVGCKNVTKAKGNEVDVSGASSRSKKKKII